MHLRFVWKWSINFSMNDKRFKTIPKKDIWYVTFSETQIGTRDFGKLCMEIWQFIVEHAILNDNLFSINCKCSAKKIRFNQLYQYALFSKSTVFLLMGTIKYYLSRIPHFDMMKWMNNKLDISVNNSSHVS